MQKKKRTCYSAAKHELLKTTFDKIPSLICVVDQNQMIKISNKTFNRFFGIRSLKNLSIGKAIGCLDAKKDPLKCGFNPLCAECNINRTLNKFKNSSKKSIEKTIRKNLQKHNRNHEERCLKITVSTLNGNNDQLYLICFEDLTEFEKINQEKNIFIGIAAHDLRNPIAIIQGMSEILIEDSKNFSAPDKKLLYRINQNALYMSNLVKNLLDISHIESGLLVLEKKLYNYSDFIKKTVSDNEVIAKKRKLKLKLTDNTNKKNILVFDFTYIEQVVNNLIGNAMKFSEKGQHIEITVEEDNTHVITTIKDHGPGIKKADQKKLFGVFQKTENQPKSGEKSTGLGLAIVKKVISAHEGTIYIDSKKGKYTAFSFSLPK